VGAHGLRRTADNVRLAGLEAKESGEVDGLLRVILQRE
jgi:hypothetical protein